MKPAGRKHTPWFSVSIKPPHVGVYMVKLRKYLNNAGRTYYWWDGRRWCGFGSTPEYCVRFMRKNPSFVSWDMTHEQAQWRGLAPVRLRIKGLK